MVYGAIEDCWSSEIWIYFAIINLSCGIWGFAFNSGHLWGVNLSVLCQFVNLAMNELLWIAMGDLGKNSLVGSSMGTIIRNFVAFFNGWFIAAAGLGLFIVLVYNFGLSLDSQLVLFWIAAPLLYAAFIIYNIWVIGTFSETIGLFFSMGWAIAGAGTASLNKIRGTQVKN